MDLSTLTYITWHNVVYSLSNYIEMFFIKKEFIDDLSSYTLGIDFDQLDANFNDFILNYSVGDTKIIDDQTLVSTFGLLATDDSLRFDEVMTSNEALLDHILSFYGFNYVVSDFIENEQLDISNTLLSDLATRDQNLEMHFPEDSSFNIEKDQMLNKQTHKNKHPSINPTYFNIICALIPQDNVITPSNKIPRLHLIEKRSNILTFTLSSFINNVFNVGEIHNREIDDLETILYYYGLGYADLDDQFTFRVKPLTNDFMNKINLPRYCTKADMFNQLHGKDFWNLIKIIKYSKGLPTYVLQQWNYKLLEDVLVKYDISPSNFSFTDSNVIVTFDSIIGSDILYDHSVLFKYIGDTIDYSIVLSNNLVSESFLHLFIKCLAIKQATALINSSDYNASFIREIRLSPTIENNQNLMTRECFIVSITFYYILLQRV